MNPNGPMPPTPPRPQQSAEGAEQYAPQPPVAPAAPPYAQPTSTQQTNGVATAALVLGILGFVWVLPVIGSILGIVLGIVALNQIKKGKGTGRGMAHTGLWLGVAGLVIQVLIVAAVVAFSVSGVRQKAADSQRKIDLTIVRSQLETYYADKGYYPGRLTDMPSFSVPSTPPPVGEAPYSYAPTPSGCESPLDASAAVETNAVMCTGYTIKVTLEDGTEYIRSSDAYPSLDGNNYNLD